MEKIHTSVRLKQIMKERNLKQVDVLNLAQPICTKYGERLGKNDLSQYVSGKIEPGQRKLFILGKALNVNPLWLMGLDAPKEAINYMEHEIGIETYEKEDATADIFIRLRTDSDFYEAVQKLHNLSPTKLQGVISMLSSFEED